MERRGWSFWAVFAVMAGSVACFDEHPGDDDDIGGADGDADADADADPCDDQDDDGFTARACGGDDCVDDDEDINPGAAERHWVVEDVDIAADDGESCALAMDGNGAAHVAYMWSDNSGDEINHEFRYATNASGVWVTEAIEPDCNGVHQPSDIVVDAQGTVHIAYGQYDTPTNYWSLRYATRTNGAWQIEVVDDPGVVVNASLALDGAGDAHIAYTFDPECHGSCGTPELRYATNADGAWTNETIDTDGPCIGASLAIDADGAMRVGYLTGWLQLEDLRYATNRSGAWTHEEVASLQEAGGCCTSLLLDDDDAVLLSFPGTAVGLATDQSGAWALEDVGPAALEATYSVSMARDASSAMHIGYISMGPAGNYYHYAIQYATGTPGNWSVETLDEWDLTDSAVSLALAPDGGVHMTYVDRSDVLVHATRVADDGVDQDCDGDTAN